MTEKIESHLQEELFPDIAKKSEEDPLTKRRRAHKEVRTFKNLREIGRTAEINSEERKNKELAEKRKAIIEEGRNPNWENLKRG